MKYEAELLNSLPLITSESQIIHASVIKDGKQKKKLQWCIFPAISTLLKYEKKQDLNINVNIL